MKEMCKIITPYKCVKCNKDSLFFTTKNNILIEYKSLIDNGYNANNIIKYLETKDIKYLKCLSCGKIFIIDWTLKYPKQVIDKNILKEFGV